MHATADANPYRFCPARLRCAHERGDAAVACDVDTRVPECRTITLFMGDREARNYIRRHQILALTTEADRPFDQRHDAVRVVPVRGAHQGSAARVVSRVDVAKSCVTDRLRLMTGLIWLNHTLMQ